jgi:hypothetical protein
MYATASSSIFLLAAGCGTKRYLGWQVFLSKLDIIPVGCWRSNCRRRQVIEDQQRFSDRGRCQLAERLFAMAKILWLVLICAPFVGALFVVWTTIINASTPPANPITSQTAAAAPIMEEDDDRLAKADRLPLSGSPSPSSNADNANLATIEPERPDQLLPTISEAPPLASKPAATRSTRPPARRHATRPPTVRRRPQPERVQQAPSPGGRINETNGVTSWHWRAGSAIVERH